MDAKGKPRPLMAQGAERRTGYSATGHYTPGAPSRQDCFAEARQRVTAEDAAHHYGIVVRRGWSKCPFHREKTASLRFYPDGGFYCFGCHVGGSSIDFTSKLLGLTPLDAVRKLDADFHLGLELDKPLTEAERKAAEHRRDLTDTWERFNAWNPVFRHWWRTRTDQAAKLGRRSYGPMMANTTSPPPPPARGPERPYTTPRRKRGQLRKMGL